MTNFKTEIEEIEKRFDEKFCKQKICKACGDSPCSHFTTGCPWYVEGIILNPDGGNLNGAEQIKAFFFKEVLPSLLSKFAAEINTPEKEAPDKDTFAQEYLGKTINPVNILKIIAVGKANSWNAHHRSVAEKAGEIIKQLQA